MKDKELKAIINNIPPKMEKNAREGTKAVLLLEIAELKRFLENDKTRDRTDEISLVQELYDGASKANFSKPRYIGVIINIYEKIIPLIVRIREGLEKKPHLTIHRKLLSPIYSAITTKEFDKTTSKNTGSIHQNGQPSVSPQPAQSQQVNDDSEECCIIL